tara:strand:+ start:2917 stop:3054 length:138 start_codon:yes stop_codon:yes gene_type:complete
MDNIQNQNWSYLALYYLDLIVEEQEETEEMVKQFFKGGENESIFN